MSGLNSLYGSPKRNAFGHIVRWLLVLVVLVGLGWLIVHLVSKSGSNGNPEGKDAAVAPIHYGDNYLIVYWDTREIPENKRVTLTIKASGDESQEAFDAAPGAIIVRPLPENIADTTLLFAGKNIPEHEAHLVGPKGTGHTVIVQIQGGGRSIAYLDSLENICWQDLNQLMPGVKKPAGTPDHTILLR